MLEHPERYGREQLASGVSSLCDMAEEAALRIREEMVAELRDLAGRVRVASDDEAARDLIENELPMKCETALGWLSINLDDDDIPLQGGDSDE